MCPLLDWGFGFDFGVLLGFLGTEDYVPCTGAALLITVSIFGLDFYCVRVCGSYIVEPLEIPGAFPLGFGTASG